MSKRAFLILGPEGSGTHMLHTAVSISALSANENYKVIHRSLPHAHKWPNIQKIIEDIRDDGFRDIEMLFILRDFNATYRSVLNRDPERNPITLQDNQVYAIRQIGLWFRVFYGCGTILSNHKFTYVTYEAFVGSEGFRRWLFEKRLGLPYPEGFEVYDGNAKYYGE